MESVIMQLSGWSYFSDTMINITLLRSEMEGGLCQVLNHMTFKNVFIIWKVKLHVRDRKGREISHPLVYSLEGCNDQEGLG